MANPNIILEGYAPFFIYLILRIILGILFFFQAYEKIFRLKLDKVATDVYDGVVERGIPMWFTKMSVYSSSYIELIGGLMLIFGLFTLPVLYIMGLNLIMAVMGFSYLKGIWDMKHVFPRLIILSVLCLYPVKFNIVSLDHLLF